MYRALDRLAYRVSDLDCADHQQRVVRRPPFDRAEKLGAQLQATTGFETASWDSFVGALKVGTNRLQLEMPKLTDPAQRAQGYLLIDLAAARQLGVRPIAYKPVEPKPAESKPRDLRRVR